MMGKRMPPPVVERMRRMKGEQHQSIKVIARTLHCAPSTVSTYCRDLYENSQRQYPTEQALRQAMLERQGREREKPEYKMKMDLYYATHPEAARRRKGTKPRTTICLDCPKVISHASTRCKSCESKHRDQVKKQMTIRKQGRPAVKIKSQFKVPSLDKALMAAICGKSPTDRHHWLIEGLGQGVCKYCGEGRQFTI